MFTLIAVTFLFMPNAFANMCGQHLSISEQAQKFIQMKDTGMDCLRKQTQDGDVCACSDTFEAHEKLLGPLENETEKYEKILEKDRKKAFIEAYRKDIFNKIDDALRSDILLEKGKLNPLDLYQKKECSMSSFYSSIQQLKSDKDNNYKCEGLYENASLFFGKKVTKENLDQVTKDWSDNIANYSEKILSNNSLGDGGFPAKAWYMTKTPSAASTASDFIQFSVNRAEQKDNFMLRPSTAYDEEIGLYLDSKDYRDFYKNTHEYLDKQKEITIQGNLISKRENGLLSLFMAPPAFLKKVKGGPEIRLKLMSKWKALVNEQQWPEKDAAKRKWKNIQDFLTDRDNINIALKAVDASCKQTLGISTAKDIFCPSEATLSAESSLKIVTPNMTVQALRDNPIFDKEPYKSNKQVQDNRKTATMDELLTQIPNNDLVPFFIAKANYMKFCPSGQLDFMSTLKTNAEEVIEPEKVIESHLQKLIDGNDGDYNNFSSGIGAIFKKHEKDQNFDAIKNELEEFYLKKKLGSSEPPQKADVPDMCKDMWVEAMCSDPERENYDRVKKNIESILNLPEGYTDSDIDSLTTDTGEWAELMEAKELLDNLKNKQQEDPQQNAIASYLAPSDIEDAKTPIFSSYTQRSTASDVERARAISNEVEAARIEGRPINQSIIDANAYRPRDLSTGEIIASAPIVNGQNRFDPNIGTQSTNPSPNDQGFLAENGQNNPPDANTGSGDTKPSVKDGPKPARAPESQPIASMGLENSSLSQRDSSATEKPITKDQNSEAKDPTNIRDWSNAKKKSYLQDILNKKMAKLNKLQNSVKNLEGVKGAQDAAMQNEIASKRVQIDGINNYIQRTAAAQVAQDNLNSSWGQNRASPYTTPGQEGRFPAAIEDGKRAETSDKKKKDKRLNKKKGKTTVKGMGGSSGAVASGGPSSSGRGLASIGVVAAAALKIKGFKDKSLNDCYSPNLHYIYPCFIHINVLKDLEIVDDLETSEGRGALNNPKGLVHDLGLEGKMFAIVQPLDDKNEDGEEQVEIISYDWEPPSNDLYSMMDDENFRNGVIEDIYKKRWDFFYLKRESARTKIYERKTVTRKELNQLMADRQTEMIVSPTANYLIQNVAKMNSNAQNEHEVELDEKIKELGVVQ